MIKTGNLLRVERENKGLSLHEVSMALKVSTKILRSIEEGDRDHLPAKTFLRGFVRSYAMYLRLDPEVVLKIFLEEMGTTRPAEIVQTSPMESETPHAASEDAHGRLQTPIIRATPGLPGSPNSAIEKQPVRLLSHEDWFSSHRIVTAVGIFFLVVLIALASRVIDRYQAESETSRLTQIKTEGVPLNADAEKKLADSPSANLATSPTLNALTALPAASNAPPGNSGASATNTSPSSNAPSGIPGSANQVTAAPPNLQTPTAHQSPHTINPTSSSTNAGSTPVPAPAPQAPKKAPAPAVVTTENIAKKIKPPPEPSATSSAEKKTPKPDSSAPKFESENIVNTAAEQNSEGSADSSKPVEVIVEAKGNVKIISRSQDRSETVNLGADQIHVFRSGSGLRLEFSDGGAANVIVNGKERGPAGTAGKSAVLTF